MTFEVYISVLTVGGCAINGQVTHHSLPGDHCQILFSHAVNTSTDTHFGELVITLDHFGVRAAASSDGLC